MTAVVTLTVGDAYYTIPLRSYSPPTAATRHDPGDSGYADLARSATVEFSVGVTDVERTVTVILGYAAERGISMARAEQEIEDMALEAARDDAEAAYEDYCDRLGDEQREAS